MEKDKAKLADIGIALYGDRWQTDIARDLGLKDGRRIRQWLSEERPIPPGVWTDLEKLLQDRRTVIEKVLKPLERENKAEWDKAVALDEQLTHLKLIREGADKGKFLFCPQYPRKAYGQYFLTAVANEQKLVDDSGFFTIKIGIDAQGSYEQENMIKKWLEKQSSQDKSEDE